MHRRRVLGVLLLLTCSLIVLFPTPGYANDNYNYIYPFMFEFHSIKQGLDEEPLFLKYSMFRYWFEVNYQWLWTPGIGFIYRAANFVLSLMMVVMGFACLTVILLADWALNYEGLDGLATYVETFVTALRDELFFGELLGIMIFFLGVSLIFSFGRNEDVAGKLMKVILNLVIAVTLMANMGSIIRGVNAIGKLGSDAVFLAFSNVPGVNTKKYIRDDKQKARNAMLNVYDSFFKVNFFKPWQLANYGLVVPESGPKTGPERQVAKDTHDHLNSNPLQRFFIDAIENMNKNFLAGTSSVVESLLPGDLNNGVYGYMTVTPLGIPFRFFIVMLTYMIGSAYGLLLLAIAGTTIFAKLVLLFLAMISPLIFLLVLIPEWGDEVLLNWVKGMIAAGTYWIVASLMLVMILFIQHQLYEVSGDNWLLAMFLQCVLLFTVFRFRNHIWDYIPISQMAMMNAAETAIFEKGKEALDKTREAAIEGGTFLAAGIGAVATGNPALLTGFGKSKMGAVGKGVLEEAANIRRDARVKGEKTPGMTKALRQAINKQFGLGGGDQQSQRQQQFLRSHHAEMGKDHRVENKQHRQHREDAEFVAGMNAATAALQKFTAALHGAAHGQGKEMGQTHTLQELGKRPVDNRQEYAVFDKNNHRVLNISKGQVLDSRTGQSLGVIRGSEVYDGSRKIGSVADGQIRIQIPTSTGTQVVGGKIYEPVVKTVVPSVKELSQDVKAKINVDVDVQPRNLTSTVNPVMGTGSTGTPSNVSSTHQVERKETEIHRTEKTEKTTTMGSSVSVTGGSSHVTITTSGSGGVQVGSSGSGESGGSGGTPRVFVNNHEGSTNVNVYNGDTGDSGSGSGSSSNPEDMSKISRSVTTGGGMSEAEKDEALELARREQEISEKQGGGWFNRILNFFRR